MCSFLLSPWELHSDVYSLHTGITLPLDCCLHGFFSSFSIQPIAQVYLKWDFLDNKYLNCVVLFTWIIQVMKQCILESIFYYIFCAIISILWFNFALFFFCSYGLFFVFLLCASFFCFIFQLYWELVVFIFNILKLILFSLQRDAFLVAVTYRSVTSLKFHHFV